MPSSVATRPLFSCASLPLEALNNYGFPTAGAITLNAGGDRNGDGVLDGAGWFIDPTPGDHSEFAGAIINAFTGQAPVPTATNPSPAFNQSDLYSVVAAEMLHVLGMSSNSSCRFQTDPSNLTTQILDGAGNPINDSNYVGTLWNFTGPNVSVLMTSNNGGPAAIGGVDRGVPVHIAQPQAGGSVAGLFGIIDGGNATGFFGTRTTPSNLAALMLQDAYGYTIHQPERFGTFYSILNTTTGDLLIRGSDGQNSSDDRVTIERINDLQHNELIVSVDIGLDTPGTWTTDAFVTRYNLNTTTISSITIQTFDGDDVINLESIQGLIPVTVDAGAGDDVIHISQNARQMSNLIGSIITVTGGGDNDQLIVHDDGQGFGGTYAVEAGSVSRLLGPTINFSDIDAMTLQTGSGASTVRVYSTAAGTSYTINTGSGIDTFNIGSKANLMDGIQADVTINPGLGANVLNFNDQANTTGRTWTVEQLDVKCSGAAKISQTSSMTGGVTINAGSGADTLNIVSAAQPIPYTVNGDGGVDTFNLTGSNTSLTLNGGDQDDVFNDLTGVNSATINGGNGTDTLVGAAAKNTWDVTANDAGKLNSYTTFSSVENLTGGSMMDLFVIGKNVTVSGKIDGASGYDQLEYWHWDTRVFVNLTAMAARSIYGEANNGISSIEGYIGGSAADDLTGPNLARTWNVTAANAGNISNAFWFSAVENLMGGAQNDNFVFSDGATLALVGGGNGTDTLDYTNWAKTRPVNTWTFGGFGLNNLNGTMMFSGFEDLLGGANDDRFVFASGGMFGSSWSRDLDGGGGVNILDYAAFGVPDQVTVDLAAGTASKVGRNIRNMTGMVGGVGLDTLVGKNVFNTWNVTGANNKGNVNGFTFDGVEYLTGGSNQDRFVLGNNLGVSGMIRGGGSTDSLEYTAYNTSGVTVNLGTGTATNLGGVAGIEIVMGSSKDDTLTGDSVGNVLIGNNGRDKLDGSGGNDILIGGLSVDTCLGGAGEDILIGGRTFYDNNVGGLKALLDEWSQTTVDYLIRYDNVLGGKGLTNGAYLNAQRVYNDFSADSLTGGPAERDWFFWSNLDMPVDWNSNNEKRTIV